MSYKKLKNLIFNRASGLCEYCKSPAAFSPDPFCLEHIIPKSKKGKTEQKNLALSCYGCNNHKYTKTQGIDIVTEKEVLLFNPREQNWNEHFTWNENATLIIGLTATGRITVEILKLNRQRLQNIRKLLFKAGEHPPD